MRRWLCQVEVSAAGGVAPATESDSQPGQPVDRFGAVLDHETDHFLVAQTGSRVQRVLDMGFEGILFIEDGGDAALGVVGAVLLERPFRQHRDGRVGSHFQRQTKAGGAAADDDDVKNSFPIHAPGLSVTPRGKLPLSTARVNRKPSFAANFPR